MNISFPEIVLMLGLFAIFVFEVAMLVNVWQSSRTTGKKLLWTAIMAVCNPLAAIIYFFGFRQKSSTTATPQA